jgi:hypothetical protein
MKTAQSLRGADSAVPFVLTKSIFHSGGASGLHPHAFSCNISSMSQLKKSENNAE